MGGGRPQRQSPPARLSHLTFPMPWGARRGPERTPREESVARVPPPTAPSLHFFFPPVP